MITSVHDNESILWQAIAILALPLVSSIVSGLIRATYAWLAPMISSLFVLVAFCFSLLVYFQVVSAPLHYSFPWLEVGEHQISINLLLDEKTTVMIMVVTFISLLVHLYSIGYMSDDSRLKTYFSLLGFFTFAMLGLVLSTNLLISFFFWELLGYSSYRLIGFWNTKAAAAQAATKSFLINRVADVFFLGGILIFYTIGSLEITALPALSKEAHFNWGMTCLFIGVMGKSAQFPFFTWLPDAMEGPTPVSALIHAATMVAAGIFVLIQLHPALTPEVAWGITIIGLLTALIGGIGALFQFDIKKILAYSTMSQLGLMMVAIGMGSREGAFLHLLNHAFFKAGLFLLAGGLMHAYHHHTQDIRQLKLGNNQMVRISAIILLSALAAIPFTSGFVSKEIILTEVMKGSMPWVSVITLVISLITVIYTFRLWWYILGKDSAQHPTPAVMRLPVMVLAAASVAVLISFSPFQVTGWMNLFVSTSTSPTLLVKIISLLVTLVGISLGWMLYRHRPSSEYAAVLSTDFLFIDRFYQTLMVRPIIWVSQITERVDQKLIDSTIHRLTFITVSLAHVAHWLDRMVVDKFLVEGFAHIARFFGWMARSLVGGKVQYYLLWALALLLIYMTMLLYF